MNKIFWLIILMALLALGWWGWSAWFPNPRQAIRNRLNQAASLASFTRGEGNIKRALSLQKLSGCFTEDAQITVDIPGVENHTFTRSELMESGMALKSMAYGLKAELIDVNIELGAGHDSALVDLTLKAKLGNEPEPIWQELKFNLKKINGDWLISRVDTIKTLKP